MAENSYKCYLANTNPETVLDNTDTSKIKTERLTKSKIT